MSEKSSRILEQLDILQQGVADGDQHCRLHFALDNELAFVPDGTVIQYKGTSSLPDNRSVRYYEVVRVREYPDGPPPRLVRVGDEIREVRVKKKNESTFSLS